MPRPVLNEDGYPTKPNSFRVIIKREEIDPIVLGNAMFEGKDHAMTIRIERRNAIFVGKIVRITIFRDGLVAKFIPSCGSYLESWTEAFLWYPHTSGPAGILNMQ